MKKKKIILFLILFVILVFSILIISKILIVNKICNQLSEFGNKTNYHKIEVEYSSSSIGLLISEEWIDADIPKGMFKDVMYSYENNYKDVKYDLRVGGIAKQYSENSNGEIYLTDEYEYDTEDEEKPNIYFMADSLKNYLKKIFTYSITSETINGVDCYKIKGFFDDKIDFIDKSTGELIRREYHNGENGIAITDYYWDFDCFTEKDSEFLENIN